MKRVIVVGVVLLALVGAASAEWTGVASSTHDYIKPSSPDALGFVGWSSDEEIQEDLGGAIIRSIFKASSSGSSAGWNQTEGGGDQILNTQQAEWQWVSGTESTTVDGLVASKMWGLGSAWAHLGADITVTWKVGIETITHRVNDTVITSSTGPSMTGSVAAFAPPLGDDISGDQDAEPSQYTLHSSIDWPLLAEESYLLEVENLCTTSWMGHLPMQPGQPPPGSPAAWEFGGTWRLDLALSLGD